MDNDRLMNFPPQQKYRRKKRIHSLKDPKLIKMRYNFRSLLRLWYREMKENYMLEEDRLYKTFSYDQRKKKLRKLREEREILESKYAAAPISCGWCSDMMRDLVFEPNRQCYFCVKCYEEAHKLYPDEYP